MINTLRELRAERGWSQGDLADALEQVGVCYHLDKDYRSALENYEAAIRVGADAGHLADNIAEVRKGMAAFG